MTIEERMTMIDQKVQRNTEATLEKSEKENQERENCLNKIKNLQKRIHDILKLANYAMDNGISLKHRDALNGTYANGDFFSNFWSHRLGLMDKHYLGYRKGGACGHINFCTNGKETYGFDTKTEQKVDPLLYDMKKFLEDFDGFETAFHEYIDKTCKE